MRTQDGGIPGCLGLKAPYVFCTAHTRGRNGASLRRTSVDQSAKSATERTGWCAAGP